MFLKRTLSAAALCLVFSPAYAGPTGLVVASVYWEGTRVATGSKFNPHGMTVAHRSLPFGTRLVVSYGRNMVEVVVNDRGPFVRGREIDLALAQLKRCIFPDWVK